MDLSEPAMESNCAVLRKRIDELETENARLNAELQFLKTHFTISQGMKGETLIAQLTGGALTSYAERYDVVTGSGIRIEVKYSKLNQPVRNSPTRRWNWCKPLGSMDRGKDYDFLLLIGEKDVRYSEGYLDDTPYVYFLLPRNDVPDVMDKGRSVGGMVQITSNLAKLGKKPDRPRLLDFQVPFTSIEPLLTNAKIA